MKSRIQRVGIISMHTSPLAAPGMENTGGMNVYLREITRVFGEMGVHCDLYTHAASPDQPLVTPLPGPCRVLNVQTSRGNIADKHGLHRYCDEFAGHVAATSQAYDLFFSHYWLSGLVAIEVNRRLGIPFVHMFHTLALPKDEVAAQHQARELPIRQSSEKQIMQRADRLVAATLLEKREMVERYGAPAGKIAVVPPGVNTGTFTAGPPAPPGRAGSEKIVLFVGRIQHLKGIDVLLEAIALVARDPALAVPKVLIVGGEPPAGDACMSHLRALIAQFGLEKTVVFTGAKGQDELVQYYRAADLLVLPSRYESFGMVALEAMACGRPVVVTSACGVATLIEDGEDGVVVPPCDARLLAARITALLSSPGGQRRMGAAARAKASGYGWPAIGLQLLHLFGEVAAQPIAL